ncbi:MAG: lamin tail domain-containing protein [Verrucomicrobia bacterium]|nr:lamin tail domain-containing protein [Verrucomicrobiota bacterium]
MPFLVRLDALNTAKAIDRNLWDADATLETGSAGITLSTNRLALRNGSGSVLVTIAGTSDFVLTVRANGETTSKSIRNRASEPVILVGGTLQGSTPKWSGVLNITNTVVVSALSTLTIEPNTLILINGETSGTRGIGIQVNGSIQSLGTEQNPISITTINHSRNWGQIRHDNAQPSLYQFTLISKAGRAPGEGHTGAGPAVRTSNSSIVFTSSVISDLNAGNGTIGKIMTANGSNLKFHNSILARARMGPEISGTGLEMRESFIVEMTGPDDADGIYLHESAGRPLLISDTVIAFGDDDAVDTFDSNVTLRNCILRDWANPNEDAKGVSVFHGEVDIEHCLFVNCFVGVSAKSSGPLATVRIDHCTITGIEKGVSAATKSNATAGNIRFFLSNSIVRSADAVHSDFGPEKFVSVSYCNLSEPWPGAGNNTDNPLFVNSSAGDFRMQPGSPAIDAGDPAFPLDLDGSRTDIGFAAASSISGGFFVSIVSPPSGAIFVAPTNITVTAIANSSTGAVSRVEFFEGTNKLGESLASPFQTVWTGVPVGNYTLRAVATQTGGLIATSAPVSISVASGQGPSTNLLVSAGSEWKYLDDGSDQGPAWRQANFNDGSWKSGNAQLGYGDGDEATVISFGPSANNKYPTTYFRRAFALEDPARVRSLILDILRDDGAIVYLNGQEAFRVSMPAGPADYRTYATAASEYNWEQTSLNPTLLVAGNNVLAVEVHQGNAGSSDLSFDLALSAVLSAPANSKPLVTITSPADGSIYGTSASLIIKANALDVDGTVTNVAFFASGTKLGDSAAQPYSFAWSGMPPGDYQLTAMATDATGLSGTSSAVTVSVSANVAPPTIASQFPAPGNVTNLTEILVTFSKNVVGVDASDFLMNGTPALDVTGSGREYTFTIGSIAPGTGSVSWAPLHGISDLFTPSGSFNANSSGAVWEYQLIDTVPPRVESLVPASRSTVAALTNITIRFSEPVSGIKPGHLSINFVPAAGVSGSGSGPYTFVFPQPKPGTVTVAWTASHGIRDLANNLFDGSSWSYVLDANSAAVVINEMMYHPASENPLEEYIELFNRGSAPASVMGWRFTDGVDFTFPDITVAGGAFLVVAADLATFQTKHPSVTNVIGNWRGSLRNNREDIDLDDSSGRRVDSVRYADEGDWAIRQRGPLDRGHRGWEWTAEHDGFGKSLELINPNVSNNSGQNWASSQILDGTPGRVNSVLQAETAPIVENVRHFPIVPKSNEPVRVTAKVTYASGSDSIVTLNYRADRTPPPPFTPIIMTDDGSNGDASAGDLIFSAILPAHANNTVVEFYITAVDARGNSRAWPAPAIAAADGQGPAGQVVNALYQVDDTVYSGAQPLYKIIMTEAERAELAVIPSQSSNQGPNAQMNATFISIDGTGTELRYLVGVRNRGHGTRTANPPNYRVNFRKDDPWKSVSAINLNTRQVHMQNFGSWLAIQSGATGTYSQAVQVRVNNADRAVAGAGMFGSYAANEVYDADWANLHFPFDADGNIYKVVRDIRPPNFDYRGEDKNSYTNTYFKESNVSEDDWSDVIAMLRIMGENSAELFTTENIRQVVNLDQWLTHLAVMSLMANGESGLNTGNNDDYYMYRGLVDPRFILLFHDFDQILGQPGSLAQNVDIFRSTCCPISGDSEGVWRAMARMLHSPEIEPRYYATLQRLLDTTFSKPQFDQLLDQILGSYVPAGTINAIKTWMDGRRVFVQSRIPPINPVSLPVIAASGMPRSPSPQASASLTLSGTGITHYRYRLNGGPFGPETPVSSPINLSGLANGTNTVAVIGRDSAGVWQTESDATIRSWVVNTSWPAIRLNEILAANASAFSRGGIFPDAIELFNEGTVPVNLSGMSLTDEPATPNKYTFAPGTTLGASAYLILDSVQLGFGLNQAGDGVYLFQSTVAGSVLLDSVEFGIQVADLSIGRLGQGGEWIPTQPTLGSPNRLQPLGDPRQVRINEWLASGASPFPNDFVELFNSGELPVSVGGYYLTDQPLGAPFRSRIRPLSFIPPEGYLMFVSGNGNQPDEFNFGLAAEQGEIALFSTNGSLIDSVLYGPQFPGVSQGRCPDGESTLQTLLTPTPGGPNICSSAPASENTLTLIPFNRVWKYESTGQDLGTEWINPGFNDSTWPSGPAVLGFENTPLPEPLLTPFANAGGVLTFYFRTEFDVNPAIVASGLQITHLIDDGAAFYLNGLEVGSRFNLPAAANFRTLASGTVGNASYESFVIPASQLRPGRNLFAVEVHQSALTSSDMVLGLKLDAFIVTGQTAETSVLINEILAHNASLKEPDASLPDWIEIHNPSGGTVDLAGLSLTDDVARPRRWVFPVGSFIPGKGFTTIRFDSGKPMSQSNTGFGLQAAGGAVFLIKRPSDGGTVQSSITYGLQAADWSIGRVPDGGADWVLNFPTPSASNIAVPLGNAHRLKINEWMADPESGEDWFELFNANAEPVDISRLWLSDSLSALLKHPLPPLSFIGNGVFAFQHFVADANLDAGADHVDFKLSASGESLVISTLNGTLIDGISFGPQVAGVAQGRFPNGASNVVAFEGSPTPGIDNYLPFKSVFINEVLSHSDPPLEDAIELYNATDTPLEIGGWYLSDSERDPRKFLIPANTVIPSRGFTVFYEFQFNRSGAEKPFAISSAKEGAVFLSQAADGVLSGYRALASFGPAENGVSFGRFQTSQGAHFVPMSRRTLGVETPSTVETFRLGTGAENSYARIGPVVFSEIMYQPKGTNTALEYLELRNVTSAEVSLFDPLHPENTWRLGEGIDFQFATGTRIPPGGHLVVVGFSPEKDLIALSAFQQEYGLQAALVGPYQGRLNNGGDSIELLKPDPPQTRPGPDFGTTPYVVVDRVDYLNTAPWPQNASGSGLSIQKPDLGRYGNDPVNWIAATPTPGAGQMVAADSDGDGLPDDWETANRLDPNDPLDADLDFDGDGLTNRGEHLAGTDPHDPASGLHADLKLAADGSLILLFATVPERTYAIEFRESLLQGGWETLSEVQSDASAATLEIPISNLSGSGFLRISVRLAAVN